MSELGTCQGTKTDDSMEKFQRGWEVIFNPKIYIADLNLETGLFFDVFRKQICNVIFRKWSEAIKNFSENSSVLIASSVGKKKIEKNVFFRV